MATRKKNPVRAPAKWRDVQFVEVPCDDANVLYAAPPGPPGVEFMPVIIVGPADAIKYIKTRLGVP